LASGGTIDQLRALLLGSQEYFNRVTGGTASTDDANAHFVTSLYYEILGRDPDAAGATAWRQALDSGADRGAVAGSFLRSAEGNADEVDYLYPWLLHRPADPAGLQNFSSALQQGTPVELLTAIIAGSPEYASTRT
jgi:hypothetical protein